jgi:hypothetical protein
MFTVYIYLVKTLKLSFLHISTVVLGDEPDSRNTFVSFTINVLLLAFTFSCSSLNDLKASFDTFRPTNLQGHFHCEMTTCKHNAIGGK